MTQGSVPTVARARAPFRMWMALFTLSWLPLFLALIWKARLAADTPWWHHIYDVAGSPAALRGYWFVTIPIVGLALIAAAIILLLRRPNAALITTAIFVAVVVLNIGEFVIIMLANYDFTTTIGTAMHIPPQEIAGFQPGITASLGSLAYETLCLFFLFFGRKVEEAFGPVTLRRLRLWIVSILRGGETKGGAAV